MMILLVFLRISSGEGVVLAGGWLGLYPCAGFQLVPLTTLSHMLDCQLFGLHAGGHHLVNVLWHGANAVLLFLVLRHLTGSLWRSAFVAALFAVHPLRAESVAWVSERKVVLSGFFFLLAIGVYAGYVEKRRASSFASSFGKPTEGGDRGKGKPFYALVLVFFTLGLLAKSMVATLPFVLLLLDWWPLGRMKGSQRSEVRSQRSEVRGQKTDGGEQRYPSVPFWRLVREKVPLFLLSAGACVAAARTPGLLVPYRLPILDRIANAAVAYVVYLRQMIFPAGLATPYPLASSDRLAWKVCLALLLLAMISTWVALCWKNRPWLLMGWLWYLGMLFPVIGIVQISGEAAHANRYTYLPEIGLAVAATWAVAEWAVGWKHRRAILGGLMVTVVGALSIWGHVQTSFWHNDESLWNRALACTGSNSFAHFGLGIALFKKGEMGRAIAQYREALEIKLGLCWPGAISEWLLTKMEMWIKPLWNTAQPWRWIPAIRKSGLTGQYPVQEGTSLNEAMEQYQKALEIDPANEDAHFNQGIALFRKGDIEGAIAHYRDALKIRPDNAEAQNNLGMALAKAGRNDEAITSYRQAIKSNPRSADAYDNLAVALAQKGKTKEAIDCWQKALEIKPDRLSVLNNLAWPLATALKTRFAMGRKPLRWPNTPDS